MTLRTPGRRYRGVIITLAVLLTAGSLGCGVLSKAKNVVSNISTITDFADKIGKAETLTYTAEYKLTDDKKNGTAKVVQQPPSVAYLGQDGSLIVTQDSIYTCGTSAGKTTCTKAANSGTDGRKNAASAASIGAGFVSPELAVGILIAAAASPQAKVDKSSRKIAGQSSDCIKVTNTNPEGQDDLSDFTVCITDKGILSEFSGKLENGQEAGIELTKFSGSADASAFTPPAGAVITDIDSPAPTAS
jgi:hypothetical protein